MEATPGPADHADTPDAPDTPAAETNVSAGDATPRSWSRPAVLAVAIATAVVFAPVLVALIGLVRPTWYPTGDLAQAELHVRAFWSDPPLVGAAGRIATAEGVQGSHPGPALWLAMWPVYALLGGSSAALMTSVVVVHLCTAALALWLAWRRGGLALVALLAACLVLVVRAGGPEVFTEPWNPWMALLPFLVVLLALWSVLVDDLWAAPIAVLAGSYSVQAHAGYLLVVGGLFLVVLAVVVWRHRRVERARAARWVGLAVLLGVVAWIPPLVDQLRREPGNLSVIRESFGRPDGPYLGIGEVAEIATVQFNLLGPWVFGPARDSFGVVALVGYVAAVLLWAVAIRSSLRRHASDELALHALLGAAWVLALLSITRIFGRYFEYTIRWVWFLMALTVAGSLWSWWNGRRHRAAAIGRFGPPLLAAVTGLVVVVAIAQFAARSQPTGEADSRIVGGLVPEVIDGLDRGERYLLRWWDPTLLGATGFGAGLELERRGYTVGYDPSFSAAVMPHRIVPEETADAVLYLVLGEPSIERARAIAGLTELGGYDLRTSEQQARSAALRVAIEEELTRAGQADRIVLLDEYYGQAQLILNEPRPSAALLVLLEEYVELRQPAVLFRAEPGTAVFPLGAAG